MSMVIATERRHWRTRVLYAGMYLLVSLGALTMVYPFLVMLSGSFKSSTDVEDFDLLPRFLFDDRTLYRKFVQARYNASQPRWQITVKSPHQSWDLVTYPAGWSAPAARDIAAFIASGECEPWMFTAGQAAESGSQPRVQRQWRNFLSRRFGGDIDRLNRAMGTRFQGWYRVPVPEMTLVYAGGRLGDSPIERLYREEFRPTLPPREFWPVHLEGAFYFDLLQRYRDVAQLNATLGTAHESLESVPLAPRYPEGAPEAPAWEQFVRESANVRFLRLRPSAAAAYRAFLAQRYGDTAAYNRAYGASAASFDEVALPATAPEADPGYVDFQRFIQDGAGLPHVEIDSFDTRYRAFLARRYGSIEACSAAHGRQYESFETLSIRLDEYDAWLLQQHRGAIVREFLVRNYIYVVDFLGRHGSAMRVTALYVGLTVLLHLLVNPLAAYALSRYRLRIAHWVLLFCVLTMAFPSEVGSIPRFLLIRELGLLNTIWALVLPGAAHGFSIFILKSFFDGLPQELYEAGMIEGAGERWMFWNVTVALTKPVLAVTAFGAFTSAYGAFLFALIICPEEHMWTVSVWLYQFQQQATEPVRFASLVVASLPVLGAFLLMQRFILRGIVLPVER